MLASSKQHHFQRNIPSRCPRTWNLDLLSVLPALPDERGDNQLEVTIDVARSNEVFRDRSSRSVSTDLLLKAGNTDICARYCDLDGAIEADGPLSRSTTWGLSFTRKFLDGISDCISSDLICHLPNR